MIETIYIARHGFRANWVNNNWTSPTGLARDPPLSAFGETQAQELANYFLTLPENQRPTAIFSSPYYRCLQTSKPVSKALGVPIYVEHGTPPSPPTPASTHVQDPPPPSPPTSPRLTQKTGPQSGTPPRVGEDVAQVHARLSGFLDLFVPEVERLPKTHTRILLVSHAATVIALARALVGEAALPLRVGCCTLTEVVRRGDVIPTLGGWEAKLLADGGHLKEGSSRAWGFEDIEVAEGKVVSDPGVPGTEDEKDELVGPQVPLTSNL
ncbi:phosphoglycerate mutase-like protein [Favolaschia claudopus]|uniref:Phosphoglycerate mutase-like protein n=1 Tax=Favolaschia claudopus TaxID=2862362 RepID=A0AAW0EHH3_9AGAR